MLFHLKYHPFGHLIHLTSLQSSADALLMCGSLGLMCILNVQQERRDRRRRDRQHGLRGLWQHMWRVGNDNSGADPTAAALAIAGAAETLPAAAFNLASYQACASHHLVLNMLPVSCK